MPWPLGGLGVRRHGGWLVEASSGMLGLPSPVIGGSTRASIEYQSTSLAISHIESYNSLTYLSIINQPIHALFQNCLLYK